MALPGSDVATDELTESARQSHAFPAADTEHPWLGLESFREETRAYFFGRDSEITELHLRLRSHPLLVLYGRSGLGKTSILSAGLIPRLRAEGQHPVLHRLDYKRHGPFEQLFDLLFDEGEGDPVQRSLGRRERITAWETEMAAALARPPSQHKHSSAPAVPLSLPKDPASRVWLRLHWRKELPGITHLILDQFEEIFALEAQQAGTENEVRDALAILLQCSIPDPIVRLIAEHDDFLDHFDSDSTPVRVLLALRDDYVYALNRWKRSLPSLGQNTFELRPLSGAAALDAVFEPGALRCRYRGEVSEENKADTGLPPIVTKETAERIVRFVAKKGDHVPIDEIEAVPPILSLLCRELNERRFTAQAGTGDAPAQQITFSESDTDVETIVKGFYERCIAGRPDAVRLFIEEDLVSYSGARLAQDEKSILRAFDKGWRIPGAGNGQLAPGYGDPVQARRCLDALINERLLTPVAGGENPSYELIHDLLAGVVEKSRLTREALGQAERLRLEQAAQRRKQLVATAVACALAIALVGTLYGVYFALIQEHTEYYRAFTKRHGFPVGIFRISEADARKLPLSFRLIHKGVVRDGWKLHWKPVFRVEAVNGLLELTTNHRVFPYLWKGELESKYEKDKKPDLTGYSLGLGTVCKWEFVSTREGEIIYERALDRAGHMVYGLIYSPAGSGTREVRLARFVGADGFPQFQRHSAAEYVEIHYDANGWENRVMYRDSNNLPGSGPNGTFGQRLTYNERGQLTQTLSLDAFGRPMIDSAGNCGMQRKYDNRGYVVEATSLGPDKKPMPIKDGYVVSKNDYDRFGRLHRARYFGANGESVLLKESGWHGWELEYDERGNERVQTFIGLDGKPAPNADGYVAARMGYDPRGNCVRMTFFDVKGKPVLSKKQGYHGWRAEYDDKGNERSETYLGLDEKPVAVTDGYATVRMVYDERGHVIRLKFYDAKDERVLSKRDGYHGFQAAYDKSGNLTLVTYFGLDEKSAPTSDGYATIRKTYDIRGNMTGVAFYGANDEPVLSKKNGYHGWRAEYDKHGNETVETYVGLDRKPMLVGDGYAAMKLSYDSRGNTIRQTFHGLNGEPVRYKDGHYGWEAEYDEQGNKTVQTFIGFDGKPMLVGEGYATRKWSYDSRGNTVRQTFHGIKGEPARYKDGYYGWEAEYDEQGNKTVQTYIGLDGKPMLIGDGYATVKWSYDSRGNTVRATFHGVKGEPARYKDGYYGWEAEYDGQGNVTVQTYIFDGKPMLVGDGYATTKLFYDSRGNTVRQTFYGVNGEPVRHKDGYYSWEAEYDEQGNRIFQTYLGSDGKPMMSAHGYVSMKSTYDSRGKVIKQTYHGVNGEPVQHNDGYYGWQGEYDQQGNQIVVNYLGRDGKPTLIADGYATLRMAYDARGNMTETRFYDLNGQPALSKKNEYHGWETEYDKNGNETGKVYLGIDGKPLLSKKK